MRIKKQQAIFRFYRSFAAAPLTVSVACWFLLFTFREERDSSLILLLVIFKLLSDSIVYYLVKTLKARKMYYYYNLHLSVTRLWASAFIFDLFIFIIGLWSIY